MKSKFSNQISPESIMPTYEDFGIVDGTNDKKLWKKIKWCEFMVVCKTEKDRKLIRAAMEYLHDCGLQTEIEWFRKHPYSKRKSQTDFIVINQLVHNYLHGDKSDEHTDIIVDKKIYNNLKPRKNIKKYETNNRD